MEMRLELVPVPVTDVDRAKQFYAEQVGFDAEHDFQVSDEVRFVQLTPPGSACSIMIGEGVSEAASAKHAHFADPDGNTWQLQQPRQADRRSARASARARKT